MLVLQCRRAICGILAAASIFGFVGICSDANAGTLDEDIPMCSDWLAAADKFLDTCREHARTFDTTFYPSGRGGGEQEHHRVWFSTRNSNNRFVLGCVMHDNDALDFLGIYYTLFPEKIKDANRYPIQSVTFDGDVTLVADNEAVSFVAVQPFETAKIKTKWSRSDNV